MESLAKFDMEIRYRKGKENTVADALSRIVVNTMETGTINDFDWPAYIQDYKEDKDISELDPKIRQKIRKEANFFKIIDDHPYRILDNEKIAPFVPFTCRSDTLNKYHRGYGHLGINGMYDLLRNQGVVAKI